MSEFGSDVSNSEVSGDSGTTSDVSEVETGTEVSEMDEDLSHELDDSYDSYMEEGEGKSFESDFNENEEVDETELEETDEPHDELESDLDSKYDSYIEDKDLSSFEKGKAIDFSVHPEILTQMTFGQCFRFTDSKFKKLGKSRSPIELTL